MDSNDVDEEGTSSFVSAILYPELLGRDALCNILVQRCIKYESNASKEDLLNIFHRTVEPLPQRKPRSNRRGQFTAEIHKKLQAKSSPERNVVAPNNANVKLGFTKSIQSPTNPGKSRLKPPPIVTSNRKIKLKQTPTLTKPSTTATLVGSLDKTIISTSNESNMPARGLGNFERKEIIFNRNSESTFGLTSSPAPVVTDTNIGKTAATNIVLNTQVSTAVQAKSPSVQASLVRSPTVKIRRDFAAKLNLNNTVAISVKAVKTSPTNREAGSVKTPLKRMAIDMKTGIDGLSNATKTSPDEDILPKKKMKKIMWP